MAREKLSLQIEKELLNYISNHSLKEGDRIPTEPELEKLFNVSKTTIRTAISRLAGQNIVEARQGSGVYVARQMLGINTNLYGFVFTKDTVQLTQDLLELRLALEPLLIDKACLQINEEHLENLQDLATEITRQSEEGQFATAEKVLFHKIVAESSGNRGVSTLLPLIEQSIVLLSDLNRQVETVKTEAQAYQTLFKVLKQRNAELANQVLHQFLLQQSASLSFHSML